MSQRSKEPFYISGGSTGVLLLHGFAGSPAEMEPFGKSLAAAGFTVHCPVLAGHRDASRMCEAGWQEWLVTAQDALAVLKRQVSETFVAGFSLGGLIAFDIAAGEPETGSAASESLSGVISINSPLKLSSTQVLRAHLLKVSKDSPPDDREICGRVPMACLSSLYDYAARVATLLPQVTVPALVIQARQDEAIDPRDAKTIYQSLGSRQKNLVWSDSAGHLTILGAERGFVFEAAKEFIRQNSKQRGDGTP